MFHHQTTQILGVVDSAKTGMGRTKLVKPYYVLLARDFGYIMLGFLKLTVQAGSKSNGTNCKNYVKQNIFDLHLALYLSKRLA